MTDIKILQMPAFKKSYKKLHKNQKAPVDDAVLEIKQNPFIGEAKKGDLAGVYVHKFDCVNQQYLLAYKFNKISRTLICLGVHENLYRDLKK